MSQDIRNVFRDLYTKMPECVYDGYYATERRCYGAQQLRLCRR